MSRSFILVIVFVTGLTACATRLPVPQNQELDLGNGVSVPVRVWPHINGRRVLWLSSDHGFPEGMQQLAVQLQRAGFEVWQADLFAADFLSYLPSNIDKIPDRNLGLLLSTVLGRDERRLVLLADGQAAKLVARMARQWRKQNQRRWPESIEATVLVSPVLYTETPQAGLEAQYIDGADSIGGRKLVMQPNRSPYYWWLERTRQALGAESTTVEVVTNMRDRFYFRPDASDNEQKFAAGFGKMIAGRLKGK